MVTMAEVVHMPRGRTFTAADLDAMPDDGNRYEIIDGSLIVTPSPVVPHQRAVGNLHLVLRAAVTAEYEVMLAPLDVPISDLTVLQPDLLVALRAVLERRRMSGLPALAVEVLSPSTRLVDLNLKKAAFELAGVASYWVVDPDVPSVSAWGLAGGRYVDGPVVVGADEFVSLDPFPVRFCPDDLLT